MKKKALVVLLLSGDLKIKSQLINKVSNRMAVNLLSLIGKDQWLKKVHQTLWTLSQDRHIKLTSHTTKVKKKKTVYQNRLVFKERKETKMPPYHLLPTLNSRRSSLTRLQDSLPKKEKMIHPSTLLKLVEQET